MTIPAYPENRLEEYLDEIARNGTGGGSSLPEVTADDNGDVLTVVEGAWAKAAPSGGGVLVVHEADMALDKTWQEIHDADFAVVKYTDAAQMSIKFVAMTFGEGEMYSVGVMGIDNGQPYVGYYVTQSADGYPEYPSQTQN